LAIAHATSQTSAHMAIECGVSGLAHTFVDAPASPEFVQLATERKIFVVSTLSLLTAVQAAKSVESDSDFGASLLSASQRRSLGTTTHLVHPGQFPVAQENLRRLHEAGVTVLAGTDAPAPGTAHGHSLHRELELLVQAGLTPIEALAAATSIPAETFSLGERGRVKPGYRADLLLVQGDPTANIADTAKIDRIWKNGYRVSRTPQL
jgi:imidazolonepropionase-like amidohydrolase